MNLYVLVVDDDPVVRFVHNKILTSAGHHVMQAENGEIAVNLADKQAFDVILMDVQMPVLDGIAATKKIREHEKSASHSYILGVTGVDAGRREECLANGMDDVVFKPVRMDELLKMVTRVIQPA